VPPEISTAQGNVALEEKSDLVAFLRALLAAAEAPAGRALQMGPDGMQLNMNLVTRTASIDWLKRAPFKLGEVVCHPPPSTLLRPRHA
jgi:hypothetical protein